MAAPKMIVATKISPHRESHVHGLRLLGSIAVTGKWDQGFERGFRDLCERLASAAIATFPTAEAVYNMRVREGDGRQGHQWLDATGDVYGR